MRIIALSVGLALAAAAPAAFAQSPTARGLAAGCSNCHGTDGRSQTVVPNLAGMERARMVGLMKDFRDGKRPATIMHQLAKGYTDQQVEMLADWFAAQKP